MIGVTGSVGDEVGVVGSELEGTVVVGTVVVGISLLVSVSDVGSATLEYVPLI